MKRQSDYCPRILCLAFAVAGLGACSPSEKSGSSLHPQLLYAPPQTSEACTCTGTGPGGAPVTVDCGISACGSDYTTYACSASGWSWTGLSCSSGCTCTGTGPGNVPVTVDCGQSACGSDYFTYSCSASGWAWTGATCTAGTGGASGTGGSSGGCTCAGTGPGGTPVTADCGQSACGSDYFTYSCSASGWAWTGSTCSGNGGASGSGGSSGACSCTGTGPGGTPVTADCGESACGSDYFT